MSPSTLSPTASVDAERDEESDVLRVEEGQSHGARLLVGRPFRTGEVIHRITGHRVTARPTVHSVQVGPQAHMDGLGKVAYFNHSCDPNAVLDTTELAIIALRDVAAGEELTFFYPSTEWEMAQPFVCRCGAPQCVRVVAGAKYLSADVLGRYFVNGHIRDLFLAAVSNPRPGEGLPLSRAGRRRDARAGDEATTASPSPASRPLPPRL